MAVKKIILTLAASGQCNDGYFGERTWRRLHSM
jgi:hypothetical protein